jgi:hypothetical protein
MVADFLSLYSIGGLRISNLQLHSRAPKLTGLWQSNTAKDEPWMGLPLPVSKDEMFLFYCQQEHLFGNDHWHIRGRKLSVAEGLSNRRWISLIKVNSSKMVLHTSISVTDLRYVS